MIAAKAHSLVFGTRLGDGILSVWPSGGAVLTFQVGVVTDRLLGLPLEYQNLPDLTPLLPPQRSCRGFLLRRIGGLSPPSICNMKLHDSCTWIRMTGHEYAVQ